jgi:hypothetical protein
MATDVQVCRDAMFLPVFAASFLQEAGSIPTSDSETIPMRKALFLLLLIAVTPSLFAQDWRDRRGERYAYQDNRLELTPFAGYRWGGTLNANTGLFNQDVDLESSANFGVTLGIPVGNDLKVELLADHQSTNLTTGSGSIFGQNDRLGDISVTYLHAGLEVPFNRTRNPRAPQPYFVISAGVANLDPNVANASSANRFSASAGIGVKVPFSPNAGLRLEGRGFYTSTSNSDSCRSCYNYYNNNYLYQGEANLGVYFKF